MSSATSRHASFHHIPRACIWFATRKLTSTRLSACWLLCPSPPAGDVQAMLVRETVIWKRGLLVMPQIVHDLLDALEVFTQISP